MPAIDPALFRSREALTEALPQILSGPKDEGTLDLIVVRPDRDQRTTPQSVAVSAAEGLSGDHWKYGTGIALADGTGDPEAQICMMMSRCIRAIAGSRDHWAPAGDNFFIDMDLTPANMPPGTRFAIGSAEFVVSETKHVGCTRFVTRYGRDALIFVNKGPGRTHQLRGIYAHVTKDGMVSVADKVRKL